MIINNKFLEISKDVEMRISDKKVAKDARWDGLKKYITNTDLEAEKVIAQYRGLWVAEHAFRISKDSIVSTFNRETSAWNPPRAGSTIARLLQSRL